MCVSNREYKSLSFGKPWRWERSRAFSNPHFRKPCFVNNNIVEECETSQLQSCNNWMKKYNLGGFGGGLDKLPVWLEAVFTSSAYTAAIGRHHVSRTWPCLWGFVSNRLDQTGWKPCVFFSCVHNNNEDLVYLSYGNLWCVYIASGTDN